MSLVKHRSEEIVIASYPDHIVCGKIKRSNSYPQDHEPEVIKHIVWNLTENMEYQLHLSDYEVLHQLGSGSFSNVYHVKNKVEQNHQSALKLFHNVTKSLSYMANEVSMLTILGNHPNIVKMFNFNLDNEEKFLTTELCGFQTLRAYKTKVGDKIKEWQIRSVASQLCSAVEYMQQYRVIHFDLKPDNIGIVSMWPVEVKIFDFGLASVYSVRDVTKYNKVGTLHYMAPEIFLGKFFLPKADLYSLGIIFYYLVYGRTPFAEYSLKDLNLIYRRRVPITYYDQRIMPTSFIGYIKNLVNYNCYERRLECTEYKYLHVKTYRDQAEQDKWAEEVMNSAIGAYHDGNFRLAYLNLAEAVSRLQIYTKSVTAYKIQRVIKRYKNYMKSLYKIANVTPTFNTEQIRDWFETREEVAPFIEMAITAQVLFQHNDFPKSKMLFHHSLVEIELFIMFNGSVRHVPQLREMLKLWKAIQWFIEFDAQVLKPLNVAEIMASNCCARSELQPPGYEQWPMQTTPDSGSSDLEKWFTSKVQGDGARAGPSGSQSTATTSDGRKRKSRRDRKSERSHRRGSHDKENRHRHSKKYYK